MKKNDAVNALKDAESCIGLNPGFAKGYSRKGAALHALKRYNDSIAAYESGIEKFPGDQGLVNGLAQVKKDKDAPPRPTGGMPGMPGGNPFGAMFGPDLLAKIALDPNLRKYMNEPDFMEKIQLLQNDPNQLSNLLQDKRIMQVFQMILGANGMKMDTPDEQDEAPAPTPVAPPAKKEEESKADEPMEEEEEDMTDWTPEEIKAKQDEKAAIEKKQTGNDLYKKKDFDGALKCYDEAITLNPKSMTFHSNKAAVYFTMKKWDECISMCDKAVEVGKANMAPYEDR